MRDKIIEDQNREIELLKSRIDTIEGTNKEIELLQSKLDSLMKDKENGNNTSK